MSRALLLRYRIARGSEHTSGPRNGFLFGDYKRIETILFGAICKERK